jgi:hypothetical protein
MLFAVRLLLFDLTDCRLGCADGAAAFAAGCAAPPPPIGFRSFPPAPLIRAVCTARLFPAAVLSRPPRAVAPSPPTLAILPALSRVMRFLPLLTGLAAGRPDRVLPPPPANLPFASRL